MFPLKSLALLALSLAARTNADHLAVVRTISTIETGSGSMGTKSCYPGADSYAIYRVSSQISAVGSACSYDGEFLASSNDKQGTAMRGQYTNRYMVLDPVNYILSINEYGMNVLQCEEDDATVLNCPTGICWQSMERNLRCDGEWKDYWATFFPEITPTVMAELITENQKRAALEAVLGVAAAE